ncbi:MAG: DUF3325 domain-containing protein [Gammaproteobacteria bacterium]|nr:DUF3325 domain-containing protein [Gammaproteobacteria bacterium]
MPEALSLATALACNVIGLAWLALAMQAHWQQVVGQRVLPVRTATALRMLGIAGLLVSMVICVGTDHASMAALVWVMSLAAAALMVAFTLTWRPRVFAPLVFWSRSSRDPCIEDSAGI